ncbi:MAG: hypothetical protein ACJA0H_001843, partial [Francisellaceae bacterium]
FCNFAKVVLNHLMGIQENNFRLVFYTIGFCFDQNCPVLN